jgi:hypothetical protein
VLAEQAVDTYLSKADREFGTHLVTFAIPDEPSAAEILLSKEIVRVDHRSLRTLGSDSRERAEVRDLLLNVVSFLRQRQCDAANALLAHTEGVYYQHIQAKNRLRYLGGMSLGIATVIALGALMFAFVNFPDQSGKRTIIPLLLLFAGMGTITSVLLRLSEIDLRDQTSPSIVYISGMGRPITGAFLSIVVYFILALRIVDIHVDFSVHQAHDRYARLSGSK